MKKQIICKDINNKKFKVAAGKVSFRPSVYALIIKNNKILLSPQWDGYDFPGGGVEIDETIEEALAREIYEETGCIAKAEKLIYVGSNFFTTKNAIAQEYYWNCILIYYTAKIISGKISTANFDKHEKIYMKKAEWIDIDKALKLKFRNSVDSPAMIKKALQK